MGANQSTLSSSCDSTKMNRPGGTTTSTTDGTMLVQPSRKKQKREVDASDETDPPAAPSSSSSDTLAAASSGTNFVVTLNQSCHFSDIPREEKPHALVLTSPFEGTAEKLCYAHPKFPRGQLVSNCPNCHRPVYVQKVENAAHPENREALLEDVENNDAPRHVVNTAARFKHLFNQPKNPEVGFRYAYTIALWGQKLKYVNGAIVLGQSLKNNCPKVASGEIKMVCIHTKDVPRENRRRLEKAGWECRLVRHVNNEADSLWTWDRSQLGAHRFDFVFTKLRLFEVCSDFDKVVQMDIDMLCVNDLDHLFDLPAPGAMVTGHADWAHGEWVDGAQLFYGGRERTWQQRQREIDELSDISDDAQNFEMDFDRKKEEINGITSCCPGQADVDQEGPHDHLHLQENGTTGTATSSSASTQTTYWAYNKSSTPTPFGQLSSWGRSRGINAGLMLLAPSQEHFEAMLSQIQDKNHPEHIKGNGPEQDYLARFFADRWVAISPAYNWQIHQMFNELAPHLNTQWGLSRRMNFLKNAILNLEEEEDEDVEPETCHAETTRTSTTGDANKNHPTSSGTNNKTSTYASLKTFKVIHYSGDKKPWDFAEFHPGLNLEDYEAWLLFGQKSKSQWEDMFRRQHWTIEPYAFDFEKREMLFKGGVEGNVHLPDVEKEGFNSDNVEYGETEFGEQVVKSKTSSTSSSNGSSASVLPNNGNGDGKREDIANERDTPITNNKSDEPTAFASTANEAGTTSSSTKQVVGTAGVIGLLRTDCGEDVLRADCGEDDDSDNDFAANTKSESENDTQTKPNNLPANLPINTDEGNRDRELQKTKTDRDKSGQDEKEHECEDFLLLQKSESTKTTAAETEAGEQQPPGEETTLPVLRKNSPFEEKNLQLQSRHELKIKSEDNINMNSTDPSFFPEERRERLPIARLPFVVDKSGRKHDLVKFAKRLYDEAHFKWFEVFQQCVELGLVAPPDSTNKEAGELHQHSVDEHDKSTSTSSCTASAGTTNATLLEDKDSLTRTTSCGTSSTSIERGATSGKQLLGNGIIEDQKNYITFSGRDRTNNSRVRSKAANWIYPMNLNATGSSSINNAATNIPGAGKHWLQVNHSWMVYNCFETKLLVTKHEILFKVAHSPQQIRFDVRDEYKIFDANGQEMVGRVRVRPRRRNMLFVVVHAGDSEEYRVWKQEKIQQEELEEKLGEPVPDSNLIETDTFTVKKKMFLCAGKLAITYFAFDGKKGIDDFYNGKEKNNFDIHPAELSPKVLNNAAIFTAFRGCTEDDGSGENHADFTCDGILAERKNKTDEEKRQDRDAFLTFAEKLMNGKAAIDCLFRQKPSFNNGGATTTSSGASFSTASSSSAAAQVSTGDFEYFHNAGSLHAGAMITKDGIGTKTATTRSYGGYCDVDVVCLTEALQVVTYGE
ncbi:unnamed protein product [Amoebophrya sp. A120]|nr:unnamed protein product [Amoebophrya sp. A120]|eukprot:GSA120T00014523001.1